MPTLPYDENCVVQSCKLDKLVETITELKDDPKIREKLLENGEKFAEQQYNIYNNDMSLTLKKILES